MDRILDRNNYSNKTLEIYEILGSYYIDIFYNHLYIEAKKLKANGNVSSITEGYKHTLNAFLKGLSNPKLYKKSIIGLHHYFINTGFNSISFSNCVDKITKEFIPSDYFISLSSTQKMGVLRMVLNQSLKLFIRKIVDEHITKIIDFHTEKDNIRILQDDIIDCFILERENMYHKFISDNTTIINDRESNNLVERMQQEIKKLIKEKYEYQRQILLLKKIIINKRDRENKMTETIADLKEELSSICKNNTPEQTSIQNEISVDNTISNEKVEANINDSCDEKDSFIEVNEKNILKIIENDSHELHDTMLDDFS